MEQVILDHYANDPRDQLIYTITGKNPRVGERFNEFLYHKGYQISSQETRTSKKEALILTCRKINRNDIRSLISLFGCYPNFIFDGTKRILKSNDSVYSERKGKCQITIDHYNEGVLSYHQKGQLLSLERYKKGKMDGKYELFSSNGQLTESGYYQNGVRNGPYNESTSGGIKLKEGNYLNGKMEGLWKERDMWGIYSEGYYHNNVKNGPYKEIDSIGSVSSGIYKNNKKEGHWIKKFDNGDLIESGEYVGGEMDGKWLFFENEKTIEKHFKNGKERRFGFLYL